MKNLFASAGSVAFFIFFLLGQFPGGTIFMAVRCDSSDLDGFDWVLSVIIPFYGLFSGLSC